MHSIIFHPERMADRILGMGDIVSLVEKAQETIRRGRSPENFSKKLAKNQFSFYRLPEADSTDKKDG